MRPLFRFIPLLLLAMPVAARADLFDFTFVGGGATATGSWTTTDTLVGGYLTVTGITGTQNGAAITGLLPPGAYGANNNLFSPIFPYFEHEGVAYSVAGDGDSNVYYDSGDTLVLRLCTDTIPCDAAGSGSPLDYWSFVQVTTPEPSSLVLLGTGVLFLAGAARRRFRKA